MRMWCNSDAPQPLGPSVIFAQPVAESVPIPEPAGTGKSVPAKQSSSGTGRHLLAAVLSALVPGAGQFFLGHRRKAIVLFLILVAICLGFWPLRLPRFFLGLVLLALAGLGLSFCAIGDVLLAHRSEPGRRPSRWWLLIVPVLVYCSFNLIFTTLLLASGFRALKVASSAMERTLLVGDQFMIDARYYGHHTVRRQDLVVMHREDLLTVKRVIALGGDTIEGQSRRIVVNGQVLDEPFVQHIFEAGRNPQLDTFGPITVPPGCYFVLGDNRDVSFDSRTPDFGPVLAEAIAGRPIYIYRSSVTDRAGKELH